jgi:hypothetical protein
MGSWPSHTLLDLQAARPLLNTRTYELLNLFPVPFLPSPLISKVTFGRLRLSRTLADAIASQSLLEQKTK